MVVISLAVPVRSVTVSFVFVFAGKPSICKLLFTGLGYTLMLAAVLLSMVMLLL